MKATERTFVILTRSSSPGVGGDRPMRASRRRAAAVGCFLLLGFLLLGSFASAAEDVSGAGDAAHFLRNGLGARERGLGGAATALSDGVLAPFWNPAPPVQSGSFILGGELESRNSGLFQFSCLGGRLDRETWGLGATLLTSDFYNMYLLTAGLRVGAGSLGVGVKLYRFGIPGDSGTGIGLDAGIRWVFDGSPLTVELAAISRDIGWTRVTWWTMGESTTDCAAWVNRGSVAMRFPFLAGLASITADVEYALNRPENPDEQDYLAKSEDVNLSIGAELEWPSISLRAGLQRVDIGAEETRLQPTVGVGVSLDAVTINLAVIPSFLGATYMGGFEVAL